MKLSDVMANAGLATYAVVALVLFLAAFTAVVVRLMRPSRRGELERMAGLPLDDGDVPAQEIRR